MNKFLKTLRENLKSLKSNQSGFTFVELLVVMVIIAVLVAGTANYLFSQGGSNARDIERKNDMKQVAALLEQFTSSYGEAPSNEVRNRKISKVTDCASVNSYQELMVCFKAMKYVDGEGLLSLAEDPKQGIMNAEDKSMHVYLYGANNKGWKVCALLENQMDIDLNDDYAGSGTYGEEGTRTYCLTSTNRKLTDIDSVTGTDFNAEEVLGE